MVPILLIIINGTENIIIECASKLSNIFTCYQWLLTWSLSGPSGLLLRHRCLNRRILLMHISPQDLGSVPFLILYFRRSDGVGSCARNIG